jgi:DnaJ family protein A protein 2
MCGDCGGKGEVIKEDDQCPECKGKKVVKEKKVLQVPIDPGMKHGQKITFSGEADEAPGMEPGDIVFVVNEKKHDVFKRSGNDLIMEYNVQLIEALAGFSITIKHLDDRVLYLQSPKGDVIKQGDIRMIPNEGMPQYKNPFNKGNLYIQFNVEFPKPGSLTDKKLQQLEAILPPRKPVPKLTEEMEQHELKPYEPSQQKGGRRGRGGEAYHEDDDEDEDHHGGQRVQCAQQ